MPARPFYFPEIPGRTARTVSFEQETTRNAETLADACDLRWAGYHGGTGRHHPTRSIYIEDDGSCGAEVIYSMRSLDDEEDADEVADTWANVKAAGARVNPSCGFHVHVDPRPCNFTDIASLYHLWNGLEDPLYRLGGAGYSRGHRGTSYCPAPPKGADQVRTLGVQMGQGRYGLNLSRVIGSMMRCSCGAQEYGQWVECTCDLRGCTVEFRVWNGTMNQRKAHGYIALSLGLIAESQRIRYDRKRVGEMPWVGEHHHPAASRMTRAVRRILDLPMTAYDREAVFYLVRNSSIPGCLPEGALDTLAAAYSIGTVDRDPVEA